MTGGAALLPALAGFGVLALSMHRHHRDLVGHAPSRRRMLRLRCVGGGLLALSLAMRVAVAGWAVGVVSWLGFLTVAALLVVLTLAWAARR
ncbi:DUF3325 domain-containing protein [Marivibrio halodurans]|uniref:DUF3325 domain-containing protein n=1 Tax=Marivibrio halodurans TaxID=2039722 RepID=A0A8J7SL09_9PROT|nr:DUF3325 domain-containing protein [Marivibrio halodurans]MBP5856548.1 DUF3325 domain-containing protein [Marivibrio halodurans]